jgi:transposase
METHPSAQAILPLECPPEDERVFLNPSVWFADHDGYRVVFRWHEPLYRVALDDVVHLRLVAVSLRQSQLATQEEIAAAFGHSVATQQRWERRYQQDGLDGLQSKRPTGRTPSLNGSQLDMVRHWFARGFSNSEMAKRLGVGESMVRHTLRRLGLKRPSPSKAPLLPTMEEHAPEVTGSPPDAPTSPEVAEACQMETASPPADEAAEEAVVEESSSAEDVTSMIPVGFSMDQDPYDRFCDRVFARLGMLDDALPMFADVDVLPRAGVLLAVPLLVRHGLLEVFAKVYGSLHPSFYGLRTIVVTLFLLALLRIKRPEHLKEHRPQDLGHVLGLDRAPEVKTVRRKLSQLARKERGKLLMEELARDRIARDEQRVAFLYVDGHVREYHGDYRLFQAKKPQRQVAAPAVTDTWVHDANGEPLLVVTSEINATLTQVLEPILADVRRLVPEGQRITVVFDRGGFSTKLFARLLSSGFDILTYRKGKIRKLPKASFACQREQVEGKQRQYTLCDRPRVRVGKRPKGEKGEEGGKYLWLREVRVLRDDGGQTPILTSREDLSAVQTAYRMFNRWRQENFFKYMEEEFALDALVEYGAEEVSEAEDRRNPQYVKLTKQIQKAKAEVARLQGELGKQAAANDEAERRTMRGFKIAHASLRRELEAAEARVEQLMQQRRSTPKRIPPDDMQALKSEKKLIVDAIKMAAYQVETELFGMLGEHYKRTDDEGRTLLHAIFQSPARLEVTDSELRVTIATQSSPHRTAALAGLCAQLDALGVPFPGTRLRLRLTAEPENPIIS